MSRPRTLILNPDSRPAKQHRYQTAALALLLLVSGCHSRARTEQPNIDTAVADVPADTQKPVSGACDLVTQAEMTQILGNPVIAQRNEHAANKCVYTVASGIGPYVEFSVDLGDGEAAMSAMRMMASKEPGITDPYDGIGDEASAVGPALMIRTGDDLITLVFSGVEDAPGKARQIFATAKARM